MAFEARALAAGVAPQPSVPGAASNEHAAAPSGRRLAFVVDDLGIEPLHMTEVTRSIARWLEDGADRRDEVTLLTSSGDAWWSDTVGEGRQDLLAVLRRLKGRKQISAADGIGLNAPSA